MKRTLRRLAYSLTSKYIDESGLVPVRIALNGNELSYFSLSTNPIISFRRAGRSYYFRECPVLMPRDEFFDCRIKRFFSTLGRIGIPSENFGQEMPIKLDFSGAEISGFAEYVNKKRGMRRFFGTMAGADAIADRMGFSIWNGATRNNANLFDAFGFGDMPDGLSDIGIYFLWYMRSSAITFRTLRVARGEGHSFFGSVRTLASRVLAEEMGLSHLIADAQWCIIDVTGEGCMLGLLCPAVPGMRMLDAEVAPDGALACALTDLNLLDVLSCQPDHGPNNYNVLKDENGRLSVCAFDNDNPTAFFPSCGIGRALSGCAPFVDRRGRVARQHLDTATAERLLRADTAAITKKLRPYLNVLQRAALARRISKLRRAVMKTADERGDFLIDASEWRSCETDEKYGVTYLTRATMK